MFLLPPPWIAADGGVATLAGADTVVRLGACCTCREVHGVSATTQGLCVLVAGQRSGGGTWSRGA